MILAATTTHSGLFSYAAAETWAAALGGIILGVVLHSFLPKK